MGYAREAQKGAGWVAALRGFIRVSGFVRLGILARLLSPTQFGVFGIATLALGLIEMLTETGINVFLIQRADEDSLEIYIDTAWLLSIFRGLLIGLAIFVSAPWVSSYFNSPESLHLLQLTALVPFVRGFLNPALVVFQKDLRFHHEFWFRTVIVAIETVVTIWLTYVTNDPIALVYGLIVSVFLELVLSHVYIKPRPSLAWNVGHIKDILHQGKWMTSAGIFTYLATKAPEFVIGKTSPAASLGVYQVGSRYAVTPVQEIIEVVNRVTFPVYSRIAHDKERLRKALIKTMSSTIGLSICIFGLIWMFPEFIVRVALGSGWMELVPFMQPMSLIGMTLALSSPINPLLLAKKQQRLLSLVSLIHMIVLIASLWPLTVTYGVTGVIYAYVVANIVIIPIRWWMAYRLVY